MTKPLCDIIDWQRHPIDSPDYINAAKETLQDDGVICLSGFLQPHILRQMIKEADEQAHLAYFANQTHNVYLTPPDDALPKDHAFNRQVISSKGCITTDQIAADSDLHTLYHDPLFKKFICQLVEQDNVYAYADPLSSINVHYAHEGQELGWHFDNSSFAITLLLQAPKAGGEFLYVKDVRNADAGEMNFEAVSDILDGKMTPTHLPITPGSLVLFRGRNAMHCVTPTIGDTPRYLVVLAYNDRPDIALSESARMTFFGRLG